MPAVLLGQDDLKENQRPEVKEDQEATTHVTGFLVLIDHKGNYTFEPNINAPVTTDRLPTGSEVKGSLSALLSEISAQETAQITLMLQEQKARMMMDQMHTQQVLEKLKGQGGL